MSTEIRRIPIEEAAADLANILERVSREGEAIVVEKEGRALAKLAPMRRRPRPLRKTKADYEAFLSSAGGWKDVDTEKLVADIYESRRRSVRPPVRL